MPQITDVTPQKRKKERVNIFVDGKFSFSASLENLVKQNLKIGKELSTEEIAKINYLESQQYLLDKAINFLSFRPRSISEVRDYITKKIATENEINYSLAKESTLIEKTISKLKKANLLDDMEFAKWWLSARSSANPKGVNFIKIELFKKGISKETIDKVLLKAPNQQTLAKKILAKKLKYWQRLAPFERKKKIYYFLASRGFEREIIESIVAKIDQKS